MTTPVPWSEATWCRACPRPHQILNSMRWTPRDDEQEGNL